MGISDKLVKSLCHDKNSNQINNFCTIMQQFLWYSTTKQAYIQRDNSFDNLKNEEPYFMAYIKKLLKLDRLHCFESCAGLEKELKLLENQNLNTLLTNNKADISLLDFENKIRNSIAHGTFNLFEDGSGIFVGQNKAEQTSVVNFFLKIENIELLEKYLRDIKELKNITLLDFQLKVLNMYKNVTFVKDRIYKVNDDRYLILDNDFIFHRVAEGNKEENQLLLHIEQLSQDNDFDLGNKIDWVILQNTNCKFCEIYKKYPNLKIIKKNETYNYICND